jgi:hypothetical protein
MKIFLSVILLFAFTAPVAAGSAADPIDEQGARHGQAIAAMATCPGAKTTIKVAELAAAIVPDDREAFQAASNRIIEAWQKAFACQDVDPAQSPREMNGCRKAKILSCTMTWREIGPDGSALPGLLEFAPSID